MCRTRRTDGSSRRHTLPRRSRRTTLRTTAHPVHPAQRRASRDARPLTGRTPCMPPLKRRRISRMRMEAVPRPRVSRAKLRQVRPVGRARAAHAAIGRTEHPGGSATEHPRASSTAAPTRTQAPQSRVPSTDRVVRPARSRNMTPPPRISGRTEPNPQSPHSPPSPIAPPHPATARSPRRAKPSSACTRPARWCGGDCSRGRRAQRGAWGSVRGGAPNQEHFYRFAS